MGLVLTIALLAGQTGRGSGVVTNCTETGLRAAIAGGGAVTFACDGTITLSATIFIYSDTIIDAGGHQIAISGNGQAGIFQVGTNVQFSVKNLALANGFASAGAGLFNAGGTVVVTNTTFSGNEVLGAAGSYTNGQSASGGAIANQGTLYLFNCSFTNNGATGGAGGAPWGSQTGFAGGSGAGGAVWNSGVLVANGCTFAANSAVGGNGGQGGGGEPLPWGSSGYPGGAGGDGAGGALFNSGMASLVNCTLASNIGTAGAGGQGGPGYPGSPDYPPPQSGPNGPTGMRTGAINDISGECYLTNCTIVSNSGTGIQTTGTNGARLINTLLSDNLPGGNASGALTDLGHNLSSDLTCAFTNAGSLNNTFPLLGSPGNNGGLTPTVALLPGCRAIDAGNTLAAPSTDQRGVARPFGSASDIGAYEYNEPTNPGPSTIVTECTEANLLAAMSGGGHITFACDGAIALSNIVTITTNTLLDASGHQITLQGSGGGLFVVNPNVIFSVANLVITNGNPGIRNSGGFVNATNCMFLGNTSARGGAIKNESGEIFLSACLFTNNSATSEGGALDNAGTLTVDLCTFAANFATGSNGLSGNWWGQNGGFGSAAVGGAVYNAGTVTVSRSVFIGNSAAGGSGAGGFTGNHGDLGMSGGTGGNGGTGGDAEGGALYNTGLARIFDSTFASNSATGGNGGAGGAGGPSYGWGSGGPGGSGGAGGTGAGAVFNAGDIRIINSTFAFNSGSAGDGAAGGFGGSSYGASGGSGGSGGNGGSAAGAIYDLQSAACWVTNCTFAMNSGVGTAGGAGGAGGFGGYQGGNTGAAGVSGSSVGGISTIGGCLINTILAANTPGGDGVVTIVDLGCNLSSDSTCAFANSGSMNNTDPKLAPLANNGGPTPTVALQPGSPAIDAGNDAAAPGEDQRGLPRPIWRAADIGAFEYGSPALLMPVQNAAGNINVTAIGKRGQSCRLLVSENLLDWQPISTNQFASDGTVVFHDYARRPQQFYRVLLP